MADLLENISLNFPFEKHVFENLIDIKEKCEIKHEFIFSLSYRFALSKFIKNYKTNEEIKTIVLPNYYKLYYRKDK